MFNDFRFAINAVLPLVVLMVFGYVLRELKIFDEFFLKKCDSFVFTVLAPATLFKSIYSAPSFKGGPYLIFIVSMVALVFFAAVVTTKFIVKGIGARGVAIQCVYRSNVALIGLALAQNISGDKSSALMAMGIAFVVPIYNVLAVVALSFFDENKTKINFKEILYGIISNPLIIASLAGIAVVIVRANLPTDIYGEPVFLIRRDIPWLYSALSSLADCTTAIALISIGGLIQFERSKREQVVNLIYGIVGRMIIVPLIVILIAYSLKASNLLVLPNEAYITIIPIFATPTGVSSASMAASMGQDGNLARQYVLLTNILMIFTLPIWIMVIIRLF